MVYNSRFYLFATLLSLCASIDSLFLPSSSLPQTSALLNSSYINRLVKPPTPAGFEVLFYVDQGHTYDPTNFYISAVDAMYNLTKRDYEAIVRSGQSEVIRGVQFSYFQQRKQQPRPGGQMAMRIKHVVLSILVGMSQMDKENDFGTAFVEMKQDQKGFGLMEILAQDFPGPEAARSAQTAGVGEKVTAAKGDADSAAKGPITAENMNSPNLTFSQSVIDPDDPNLTIEYERYGEAIACKTLFGASLDALASSAPYDGTHTTNSFLGTDWSNQVMYQLFSLVGEKESRFPLTFAIIRRVMMLLPMRVFEEQSCGEVNFRIVYRGEKKGVGSFRVPSIPTMKVS
ncbi:MAG: hypothetical protein Q9186_006566 [Xanthomendoza sp. 1 TL-2023]